MCCAFTPEPSFVTDGLRLFVLRSGNWDTHKNHLSRVRLHVDDAALSNPVWCPMAGLLFFLGDDNPRIHERAHHRRRELSWKAGEPDESGEVKRRSSLTRTFRSD